MDTTDPNIEFDELGNCNHCNNGISKVNSILKLPQKVKTVF